LEQLLLEGGDSAKWVAALGEAVPPLWRQIQEQHLEDTVGELDLASPQSAAGPGNRWGQAHRA
jgi:hypothetical protein